MYKLFLQLLSISSTNLEYSDLTSTDTLLIFIYYERPGVICPMCKIIHNQFLEIENITKRKINFYDNPRLASRFLTIFFPALIILDHGRAHHLDIFLEKEQLSSLIEKREWCLDVCDKWYNNPNGSAAIVYSYFTMAFFGLMRIFVVVGDKVPGWVFSCLIGFLFACLVVMFVQFLTNEIKEKNE